MFNGAAKPLTSQPLTPTLSRKGRGCLAALFLLAACDSTPKGAPVAQPGDEMIACQPEGAEQLERVCRVERTAGEHGLVLTIHHPDGGFRRLLVVKDGRGVIAADGSDQAKVKMADTIGEGREIEVTIAGSRYLLPATLKAK